MNAVSPSPSPSASPSPSSALSTGPASPPPSRRDRRTTATSVASSVRSSATVSQTPTTTTRGLTSATSSSSLSSLLSSLTVGETIGEEQRPRFLRPALSTPTFANEKGTFSLVCSTTVRAPLALLLAIMLDTRTYARWNAFCPGARVVHQPRSTSPLPTCLSDSLAIDAIANLPSTLRDGTAFAMDVCLDPTMNPSKKTSMPELEVSHLEQFLRPHTPPPPPLGTGKGSDDNSAGTGAGAGAGAGAATPSPKGRVGVRLAWRIRGKVANMLTRSERVQEFIVDPTDPAVTEYVCWETYYGALATGMRHVYGKQIKAGYSAWMDGLREFAEKEWQRQRQMNPLHTAPPPPSPRPGAAPAVAASGPASPPEAEAVVSGEKA